MIIIFGLRRLRKGMGPILLRCANCGASPLVLFRVSTWFALFFIPVIPVNFKHYTVCANCKRLDPVTKAQVESARAQEEAMRANNPDAPVGIPAQANTLEHAVQEWASHDPVGSAGATAQQSPVVSPASPQVMSAPPLPPPGWFPDPVGSGGQRYWDGQRWTEHTTPST